MKTDGTVACWGYDVDSRATPPEGKFRSVSAGRQHNCGVRSDGKVECWGRKFGREFSWSKYGYTNPWCLLNVTFETVSVGRRHACGLRPDGGVMCWGDDTSGLASPFDARQGKGRRGSRSHAGAHSRRRFQRRRSRAAPGLSPSAPASITPAASAPMARWTAGGITGKLTVCRKGHLLLQPPARRTAAGSKPMARWNVGASTRSTSPGLFEDEVVVDGRATPPAGKFQSVSAGYYHTCGLKTDGTVGCWGSNHDFRGARHYGQATPPEGTFKSISAGHYHTCAVTTDGDAVCWGSNHDRSGDVQYDQATPPDASSSRSAPAASIPAE